MKTIKVKHIIFAVVFWAVLGSVGNVCAQDTVSNDSRRTFSNEELAQMLAPIALYPDPLLSQILMAATYPFEVVEADRWVTKNPYLKGSELDEALQTKDWDVSVLALCHYPKVLTMMSENLSWTASVGDAFAGQEEDVMATVQDLRARARAAGNLTTTPEQKVIVEERYILIEPGSSDYIYIPAYDPLVVYGHWWLPLYPPFAFILPGVVVTGPGVVFSPPFYVGFGVFGWSRFNWGIGNVVIIDIDRTRRFNRHVHQRRWPDRFHWRPDHDRRYVRERRAGEIPRFVPPVRTKPDMRHQDTRPVPDVRRPDRRDTVPDRRQDRQRDQRPGWNQPDVDRRKSPDARTPKVIDKDKTGLQDRRVIERDKTAEKPRISDKPGSRVPEQGVARPPVIRDRSRDESIEKQRVPDRDKSRVQEQRGAGQPVIRDRGKVESQEIRRQTPVPDRTGTTGTQRVPERDSGTVRTPSRGDQNDRQDRSRERWGERQEQKERGGTVREREERK